VTRWGLAVAAGLVALGVWGCVLLASLLRPVVLVPKTGDTLWFIGCTVDSFGVPRQTFHQVRVDR
jgi:hypothetical protein